MQRILVTGSTGFVGRALCASLHDHDYELREALRKPRRVPCDPTKRRTTVTVGDIDEHTDWSQALQNIDSVVHLASAQPDAGADAHFAVNTAGTRKLALDAARAGVRRMVFLSTAKVNGEWTLDKPFSEASMPAPIDSYARSKWLAELAIEEVATQQKLQWVILRPPIVHGPGVRGNFLHLMQLLVRRAPLPFARIANQRSVIFLSNLVDAIRLCVSDLAVANQRFLVADGDLSTPELIRGLARHLEVPSRLVPVPLAPLRWLAVPLGMRDKLDKMTLSLRVDGSLFRERARWVPGYSVDEGLRLTAQWFKLAQSRAATRG